MTRTAPAPSTPSGSASPATGGGSPAVEARSGGWLDFTRVHPRRALILAAVGAIVGLGVAGVGLFTAKGVSTFVVPAEDVATVNQQPISRLDFATQLKAIYDIDPAAATPAQKRKVLDDMIREELFVQRAQELDVASVDPDVRSAMVAAIEQQAAADAITAEPTEAQLHGWFDAHRASYAGEGTIVVRDMLFPQDRAAAAAQALKAGTLPDAVLARFGGHDTHAVTGEEFYFAAKIHLGDAAFAAASATPAGGIAQAPGGHVMLVTANSPPKPYPYERARGQVLSDVRDAAAARLKSGDERFLRQRANILIAPDLK
jgi:hypothetical protein